MASFAEILARLPTPDAQALELLNEAGSVVVTIANTQGTQGSFRVYAYVADKWNGIGVEAAREALVLYAEHTEDARLNPGKHPNIDRLLAILQRNERFSVRYK